MSKLTILFVVGHEVAAAFKLKADVFILARMVLPRHERIKSGKACGNGALILDAKSMRIMAGAE